MSKRLKTTPKFASETAERAFWERHDSTGHLNWKKAQLTVLPNLKPSPGRSRCGFRSIFLIRSRQLPALAVYLTYR